MNTVDKIERLKAELIKNNLYAYIIPTSDPHLSEYVPESWKFREWLSGFTGSAGTLIVSKDESLLWTDGRYFVQAEKQLEGSGIKLCRMGVDGVPSVTEYLKYKMSDKTVGINGKICSILTSETYKKALSEVNGTLIDIDLTDNVWTDRPIQRFRQIDFLEEKYSGLCCKEKVRKVRCSLRKHNADLQLYSKLDDIAWITNLRGTDIDFNPFFAAYLLITNQNVVLYTHKYLISLPALESLYSNEVTIRPYYLLGEDLKRDFNGCTALIDKQQICWNFYKILNNNETISIKYGCDIIENLKSIKNKLELSNLRNTHIYDAVALVRFNIWLENSIAESKKITEYDACKILKKLRGEQPYNCGESFDTIAAYESNAAMMHYSPSENSCSEIHNNGFLLVDSGGQYLTGTTDVTRTFTCGELTEEEKISYTDVLRAHIELAMAKFPSGTTGGALDALSRVQLWKNGLDYRCGTGHGVGYYLGVHETPPSFRQKNSDILKPGMIITDEPGLYESNKYGIRIENMLEVIKWKKTQYGQFLKFSPLTVFPIETKPLILSRMTAEEIDYLNRYHENVFKTLTPYLEMQECTWLKSKCKPLNK